MPTYTPRGSVRRADANGGVAYPQKLAARAPPARSPLTPFGAGARARGWWPGGYVDAASSANKLWPRRGRSAPRRSIGRGLRWLLVMRRARSPGIPIGSRPPMFCCPIIMHVATATARRVWHYGAVTPPPGAGDVSPCLARPSPIQGVRRRHRRRPPQQSYACRTSARCRGSICTAARW